jgi:indolepyruvate ferredoxin oxidoreductase beta subunit
MSVNMVLLGAMIQTDILPLTADSIKEIIKTKTKKAFVDINLKAFDLGFSTAKDIG